MIQATTQDAYQLLHDGTLVMAEMERNGICVDVDYIHEARKTVQQQIDDNIKKLKRDKIYHKWKKVFGKETNLGSRSQLAHVLFKQMKIPCENRTATRESTSAAVLEDIGLPFLDAYLENEKLKKAKSTYLNNILRESVNGKIHPQFNLHLVTTYRGSSDHPNFTNIPTRDPVIKKLVRRALKASPGHCLIDLDFKGSEVNAASWYHKDPTMLKYIETDPGRMHFDAGKACYKLPSKLMTPEIRYCGKNCFVFPEFYGDWWLSCAKNLWKAIDKHKLETAKGVPLKQWLAKKGIRELGSQDPKNTRKGTFEAHIKDVEYDFWNNKFPVYQEWKELWWESYQKHGWFQTLTGFVISGIMNRKECINYPVQGTAFHCLLWCLIRINELLHKYKMKSKLIGQIHDDAVGDVLEKEVQNYIEIATHVITVELKKHWPWIITPMRVEVEITPVGGSWYDKKEYVA